MKQISKYLVIGALAGGLAACGSDDPSSPSNQLSEEEMQEVMTEAFTAATLAFGAGRPAGGFDQVMDAIPVDATGDCPLGGEVEVAGELTDNINDQGTGSSEIDLQVNWNDCVVQTSKRKLTLNGGYAVDAAFNYQAWEVVGDARFEIEGQFTWKGGSANGTCPFQVVFLWDESEAKASVTGQTCGRNISFTQNGWD